MPGDPTLAQYTSLATSGGASALPTVVAQLGYLLGADDELPSNIRFIPQLESLDPNRPRVTRCDLNDLVQFEYGGNTYVRPRDPNVPEGVCVDTLYAYRRTDRGGDVTLYDDAANAFNRERVILPRLDAADFASVAARSTSGGSPILRDLLALQRERQVEASGVPIYYYTDRSGNRQQLVFGSFDLVRETQALQACEARQGVGTQATVDCFNALLRAAGGGTATTSSVAGAPAGPAAVAPAPVAAQAPVVAQAPSIPLVNTFGGSMSSPFSFSPTIFSEPGSSSDNMPSPSSGGILGTLGDIAGSVLRTATNPTVLTNLARAGVIRGTIGTALGYRAPTQSYVAPPQGSSVAGGGNSVSSGFDLTSVLTQLALNYAQAQQPPPTSPGDVITNPIDALRGLFGGTDNVARLNVSNSPELFRVHDSKPYLPSRLLVDLPDGGIGVLINGGRLKYGSRELGLARSIAKREGYVIKRRACGCRHGGRGRRGPR